MQIPTSFMNGLCVPLVYVIFLLQIRFNKAQLSVTCSPGEEHCFVIHIPKDRKHSISGNFFMIQGDDHQLSANPVAVVLFDDKDNALWHSKPGVISADFSLLDLTGRYHLCFGNGSGGYMTAADLKRRNERESRRRDMKRHDKHMNFHIDDDHFDYTNHDGMDRTFTFRIRVEPSLTASLLDSTDGPTPEKEVLESLIRFKNKVNNHLDQWLYLNSNEAKHRTLAESTFSSVVWWTLMQFLMLISASVAQIFYLKKYFEVKRF